MSMLERLGQRVCGARNDDQVHVIRHEAVAQQGEAVECAVLA